MLNISELQLIVITLKRAMNDLIEQRDALEPEYDLMLHSLNKRIERYRNLIEKIEG